MKNRAALVQGAAQHGQLLGTSGSRLGKPGRPSRPDYVLGDPGRPATVPTLLITVFDSSGSVISPAGTDPLSNRFAEVAHAFTVVARRGSLHELGAVVHFDTPTSCDVGPVSITRQGLRVLRKGLRVPPDGQGSSELGPSLHRAVGIAEAHPDHQATLVVLSDFLLTDSSPEQVLSDLAAFPGQVHAVVLGGRMPAGVLDERVTVTHIGRDDPPGAVARALFASLTIHRPGSRAHRAANSDSQSPRRRVLWIPQRGRPLRPARSEHIQ
jgi:hypothetical protein